jgi:hypothetical protein
MHIEEICGILKIKVYIFVIILSSILLTILLKSIQHMKQPTTVMDNRVVMEKPKKSRKSNKLLVISDITCYHAFELVFISKKIKVKIIAKKRI